MKTILSFDVGIVNLAYCIISKLDNKFEIKKWGVINIDNNKLICNHITNKKNNKLCGKNAKFSLDENYLCSAHSKLFNNNIEKNVLNSNNEKCSELKCKLISEYKYNDICYCSKHLQKFKKTILPTKLKSQNSNYKAISNLSTFLFTKLDENKDAFLDVDEVLIENQPSLINPTMKTISSLLYSYFTLRGIIDKNITKSKITSVNFISPQNKLKINKDTTDKTLNQNNLKKREEYILTKDLGKIYCNALIQNEQKYIDILNQYKKSDDLCDSFLQGFYYLFYKDGNFPNEFKEILNKVSDEYTKKLIDKEKKKIIKEL